MYLYKDHFSKSVISYPSGGLMGIFEVSKFQASSSARLILENMGFKIYRLSSQITAIKFGIEQYFFTDRLSSAKHSVRRSMRTKDEDLY
jgi:hypothetical protein